MSSESPSVAVRRRIERASTAAIGRRPSRPDAALLGRLGWIQKLCTTLAGLIGALILCGWLFPGLGARLFPGWALMKANTALLVLMSAGSLELSRLRAKPAALPASRILAAVVVLIAAAVVVEYLTGARLGIDTLLAMDAGSSQPGRMSPQTAVAFLLLGSILLLIDATERAASLTVDFLVFCLCPLVMVIVSGYAFGVLRFFGLSQETRTSPHTLLALMLLTTAAFLHRAEKGIYSVLVGPGIGSRIARIAAPLVLLVPFLLETARFSITRIGVLGESYATALVTAMASVMGFAVVLGLAWRIDTLEQEIRDLSLRDDLTGLYNRRGFFLLGERELRLARRARVPFSVLFLDLDGLKAINDTLGHETGSELLREMAMLMQACFRDADIAGRLGGDEFVVAAAVSESGIAQSARRLQQAADAWNAMPNRGFHLAFSMGTATLCEDHRDSLEEMVQRADVAMYAAKHAKRNPR